MDRHYIRPHSPLVWVHRSSGACNRLLYITTHEQWRCPIKVRTGLVQSTGCILQLPVSCPQGFAVTKPILTLTHECTWEQALAPHSKSVLYTVVRALEIKRQQLLYIHPEGQLKRRLSRYGLWDTLFHWKIRWGLKARKIWNQVPLWARSSTYSCIWRRETSISSVWYAGRWMQKVCNRLNRKSLYVPP